MGLTDFKSDLTAEISAFNSKQFKHEIIKTKFVPDLEDTDITYPSAANTVQKSKSIDTAVLFVDMRGSTKMSMAHQDGKALAPIYASFIRSMCKCAHYYGGKVRNIIGDRVMVVFDTEGCFINALRTAILMNSVVKYVLNPQIQLVSIEAGIGIDYGTMLVTKSGIVRHGGENDPNKALVWLGKPANVASKLTDVANKSTVKGVDSVIECHYYPYTEKYTFPEYLVKEFMERLVSKEGRLIHEYEYCYEKIYRPASSAKNSPILLSNFFYENLVKVRPDGDGIKQGWWKKTSVTIPGYPGAIWGGDVHYNEIKG